MANELVIKITGDIKDIQGKLDTVKQDTEKSSAGMGTALAAGAAAFAAITAEVGLAVHAFAQSELASNRLTQALINQGIHSGKLFDAYRAQASALQNLTGADDDAIVSGIALMQGFVGQQEITKEMTAAVLDFAEAQKLDLASAFTLIGKSVGSTTNSLTRYGIEIESGGTKQQKMTQIMDGINAKFGGQAEAANKGLGAMKGLTSAFGDFQENIGSFFAPTVGRAITGLTELIKRVNQLSDASKPATADLVDHAKQIATLREEIQKLKAEKPEDLGFGDRPRGGAISALREFRESRDGRLQILQETLAKELEMQAEFDRARVSGASAKESAAKEKEKDSLELQSKQAHIEALRLQAQAGAENIAKLKEEQSSVLKAMADTSDAGEKEAAKFAYLREMEALENETYIAARTEFQNVLLANDAQFQAMDGAQKAAFIQKNQGDLTKSIQTEATVRQAALKKRLADNIASNNQFLVDQQKFGTAYALINKTMHSEIYTGSKQAFGEMAQLQQSSNSTLKGIGKAAAIANVITKTAESAMNIYAGFSTIPFIGPALGIAGALAAAAFGAEQIGKITAAAQGGLITGGIAGIDSVPAMLMPGELVVPRQNYEEVIAAVTAQRGGGGGQGEDGSGGGPFEVVLRLKENLNELIEVVEAGIVERQRIGISRMGA